MYTTLVESNQAKCIKGLTSHKAPWVHGFRGRFTVANHNCQWLSQLLSTSAFSKKDSNTEKSNKNVITKFYTSNLKNLLVGMVIFIMSHINK